MLIPAPQVEPFLFASLTKTFAYILQIARNCAKLQTWSENIKQQNYGTFRYMTLKTSLQFMWYKKYSFTFFVAVKNIHIIRKSIMPSSEKAQIVSATHWFMFLLCYDGLEDMKLYARFSFFIIKVLLYALACTWLYTLYTVIVGGLNLQRLRQIFLRKS